MLLRKESALAPAARLREGTLTLGEAFSFVSGLYFRGKLTYATAFGRAPALVPPVLIITPTRGLQSPDTCVTTDVIEEFASVDVDADEPRYRSPLDRDLAILDEQVPQQARVILLGSLATTKYVDLLVGTLGDRLYYPPSFVGRGDMSRGGLLLRSTAAGSELEYAPLHAGSQRHGARPPKLGPLRPRSRVSAGVGGS
jgi:hypothetical protein